MLELLFSRGWKLGLPGSRQSRAHDQERLSAREWPLARARDTPIWFQLTAPESRVVSHDIASGGRRHHERDSDEVLVVHPRPSRMPGAAVSSPAMDIAEATASVHSRDRRRRPLALVGAPDEVKRQLRGFLHPVARSTQSPQMSFPAGSSTTGCLDFAFPTRRQAARLIPEASKGFRASPTTDGEIPDAAIRTRSHRRRRPARRDHSSRRKRDLVRGHSLDSRRYRVQGSRSRPFRNRPRNCQWSSHHPRIHSRSCRPRCYSRRTSQTTQRLCSRSGHGSRLIVAWSSRQRSKR
jgi:hypothetical protein